MTLHASLAIIISYPTSAPKLEKTKNKLKTPRKITCTFGIFFRAAYKKEKPAFGRNYARIFVRDIVSHQNRGYWLSIL